MSNDDVSVNPSNNRAFEDVVDVYISRRQVLAGGLALAATAFFGNSAVAKPITQQEVDIVTPKKSGLLNFTPLAVKDGSGPWPNISSDYRFDILIPWGTPLQPDGPEHQWPVTEARQLEQIGIGHDGMWFFSINGSSEHGVLALNHEHGKNHHVLGKHDPASLAEVRASQAAHGVSIVELKKEAGVWKTQKSTLSRRIHTNTAMVFSGPAANHHLLKTKAGNPPKGTLNNCANGYTPWGTYLTCEENFNGFFGATGKFRSSEERKRYGLSANSRYGWEQFDPRFDLTDPDYVNEEHRFGWIVEIDPMDPKQTPVKRTALGRFKHEGIAITVGHGGRIVGYMGDDQTFDYIYKFVSDDNWEAMRKRGQSPLDHGKLYAAKFNDDGSGEWLELTIKHPKLAKRFNSQAEVLIYARLAADLVGATPMDRPEWTTVAPNGDVYCTLTNNKKRLWGNAANPMAPNKDGHIIKWRDSDDHIGTRFEWSIFLVAKDSHGSEESFSDPDGLWADPDGRLFIQTDGGQKDGLNNQVLVADTNTGEVRRLFTGVTGDEITGIAVTPDRRTLFVNIQHPGKGSPKKTNFPAPQDGVTVPRDATIVITRKDGGIVGS